MSNNIYYNDSHCYDPTAGEAIGHVRRQKRLEHKALRAMTWEDYGISKYRYRELKAFCLQYPEKMEKVQYGLISHEPTEVRSGRISRPTEEQAINNSPYLQDILMIESAAREASPELYHWILASVTENLCYEDVEYLNGHGRIMVGKTDFYGYRRKFYDILNKKKLGTN